MELGHRTCLSAHGVARRFDDMPTAAVRNSCGGVKWSLKIGYAVSNQPLYSHGACQERVAVFAFFLL